MCDDLRCQYRRQPDHARQEQHHAQDFNQWRKRDASGDQRRRNDDPNRQPRIERTAQISRLQPSADRARDEGQHKTGVMKMHTSQQHNHIGEGLTAGAEVIIRASSPSPQI